MTKLETINVEATGDGKILSGFGDGDLDDMVLEDWQKNEKESCVYRGYWLDC